MCRALSSLGSEWVRQAVMTGLTVIYWDWTTAKKITIRAKAKSAFIDHKHCICWGKIAQGLFCWNYSSSGNCLRSIKGLCHSHVAASRLCHSKNPWWLHSCSPPSWLFLNFVFLRIQQKLAPVPVSEPYCYSGCFIHKRVVYSGWANVLKVARQAEIGF